ncbi:MAG: protein kinase domain-containing protein, partial [Nitrososphaerales archaeon]
MTLTTRRKELSEGIIDALQEKYKDKTEYAKEVKLFKKPLRDTLKQLEETYEPVEPLGVGSSGILIKIKDKHMANENGGAAYRVLKFPRPRGNEFTISNLKIIKEERDMLCDLSHERIVRVIFAGETEFGDLQLPWYIMEFIGPSSNLSDYLRTQEIDDLANLNTLTNIIIDISSAIEYLHQNRIVHCDIKTDNILIKMDKRPVAMLTDLGYARAQKGDPEEPIAVRFDLRNAHPYLRNKMERTSDPAAVTAKITRKELHAKFDLYALGMSILGMFNVIEKRLEEKTIRHDYNEEHFEYKYLKLIMSRLISSGAFPSLSGRPNDDLPSLERYVRGLTSEIFMELAYENSSDLLEDLTKLNNKSLEFLVPELNTSNPDVISLGAKETRVVLTDKLKRMLEQPDFDRLGSVSQLGLINYVYPSATHTRLEHALGTYAHTCEYIRSLWYNTNDPIFRAIMGKEDLHAVMLAALLHDLGYYPLAHDLEDCDKWRNSGIKHESYSRTIISNVLAKLISKDWGVHPEYVNRIIYGGADTFKEKILHSIISGPIDADKLDYLLRDGMHLGLPYAEGIDKQWLLRNLTIAYGHSIEPAIAVTDKGRVTAESFASVRFSMFSAAYWHHTVRAIKAMLRYAVERLDESKQLDEVEHYEWFRMLPYSIPNFELVQNA